MFNQENLVLYTIITLDGGVEFILIYLSELRKFIWSWKDIKLLLQLQPYPTEAHSWQVVGSAVHCLHLDQDKDWLRRN